MTKKKIANLIKQEVQKPTTDNSGAIATTQNTQMADLKLTSESLFEESKELWAKVIEIDREHQLAQLVAAQLWRLTKIVGKPALVLSFSGIRAALITVASPEHRSVLKERFNRSQSVKEENASLELIEE